MAEPRYIVVGRSRDCDLILADPSVSGRHARLAWEGSSVVVEDLGSANGTFVKGNRVDSAKIRPGDDVRFGKAALQWSDPALKPFLRQGARGDTVVGVTLPGRRFICGACGARGVLPHGFDGGALRCGTCGASLVVGRGSRFSSMTALAVLALALSVGGTVWALADTTPSDLLELAADHFGFGEPTGPGTVSRQEQSVRMHTASKVIAALDATNPLTRNLAVRIASEEDGPFRLEQVARLWTHVRGRWKYVNDPRGDEYFAAASETIANDYAGDCDDFAILLTALITSIGGESRIVMMDGPAGGHAYAEVCIEEPPDATAQRLYRHYRRNWDRYLGRQRVEEIHFRSAEECPVWLNLDWNAGVPGGSYGAETWAVAIYADGRTETLAPSTGPEGLRYPSRLGSSAQPPP